MAEHQELGMSVAAWVLGAVDPSDAEGVRAHIAGCAECQADEVRLGPAAAAMALAVDEVAPPAALRTRILAAASEPRRERPEAGSARVVALPRRRSVARRRRWAPYLAAAVAVLVLVSGLFFVQRLNGGPVPPPPPNQATFSLAGHGTLAGVAAEVTDLKSQGIAVADFTGLPDLPPGKVYELWLITPGGRADPAGVFVPDSAGHKAIVVDRSLAGYKVMAVTVETGPDGVQSPTQQPQIYGSIA
jgi:anti-sigma-K factor RskA